MKRRTLIIVLPVSLLVAATNGKTAEASVTGKGDLILYGQLGDLGMMARAEDSCNGADEHAVEHGAALDFRREDAIRSGLERLHGIADLEQPERHAHPTCQAGPASHAWRDEYESALQTLEQHVGLKSPLSKVR